MEYNKSTVNADPSLTNQQQEHEGEYTPSLSLEMSDYQIYMTLTRYEQLWQDYLAKYDIDARSRKNKEYLAGKQVDEKDLKPWKSRYVDNTILEIIDHNVQIMCASLPDIEIKDGQNHDSDVSENLTRFVFKQTQTRKNKKHIKKALYEMPAYLGSYSKVVWDETISDFRFVNVKRPDMILDPNNISGDLQESRFIGQYVLHTYQSLRITPARAGSTRN